MTMQGIELLATTRETSERLDGTMTATMEWRCNTSSPVAARSAEYIIGAGGKYPDDPDLICLNTTTRPDGKGGTIVHSDFSNRPPATFHVLRIPSRNAWGWATRTEVLRIPVNTMDFILPPGASNLSQLVKVWRLHEIDIKERRRHRPLRITYTMPRGADVAVFDPIDEQTDKLHLIRGAYYRFTPPENCVRQLNETTWELSYDWELDRGTTLPSIQSSSGSLGQGAVIVPPEAAPHDVPGLLRQPFCSLIPIRPANPTVVTGPPPLNYDPRDFGLFATVQVRRFQIDDNGWRTLPGVPNL